MKEVTKALIAAAGLGSRMYPFTKEVSKLFLPVINKPLVQYLVEELSSSGIKEIVIVSNHVENVRKFFKEDKKLHALLRKMKKDKLIERIHHIQNLSKIDLIKQDEPRGWMHEVVNAKKYLEDGPFVVCFSDILYKSKVPAVKQVITKFQETNKNIFAAGRFVFKPSVFKIAENQEYGLGDERADVNVFDKLTERGDLYRYQIEGQFYDLGNPLSYLKTQTAFGLDKFGKEYLDFLKKLIQ